MRGHHRPQADILRAYTVGIVLVTALLAAEAQALPVRRRDMTTPGTPPAGVLWIDDLNPNSDGGSLVGHEKASLGVGPAMNLGAEVFPIRERRVSDVAQVFQAERSCTVFDCVGHQFFTRSVEQGHRYGFLVAAHASQETPRTLGANGLNDRTSAADAGTAVVFHPSLEKECAIVFRVGGNHQSPDAEVAANDAALGFGLRDFDLVMQMQVPLFSYTLDLGIAPAGCGDGWMLQRHCLPKDGNALTIAVKTAPKREGHRRALVDAQRPVVYRLLSSVGSRDLSEKVTGELGGQSEPVAHYRIEGTREPMGVKLLGVENLFGHPARGCKIAPDDLVEMFGIQNLRPDRAQSLQYKS